MARFGTFLKGPLREIDENVLKCAVLHARSPRTIGSHAAFMQDLDRKNTRSADGRANDKGSELEIASVRAIYHFAGRKLLAFFTTFKAKDIKCVVFSENAPEFGSHRNVIFDRLASKFGHQYYLGDIAT